MKPHNININLLKEKELSPVNRVIYFFLHYLRYIVVLTQIVVVFVFFYRFKVDQEIIDLEESIREKQEIIKVTEPLVNEARTINFKSAQIGNIINHQERFIDNLNYFFSIVPQKIVLDNLEMTSSTVKLSGKAVDIKSIKLLYQRIKKDQKFKEVSINKISRTSFDFEFLILIKLS